MPKHMLMLGTALMVAAIAAWGGWGPLALAGAKGPNPKAPVPQTGQTECWDGAGSPITCEGTGQDGDIQAGVDWPTPRFTDRGDGTVRDNLTGLIWLRNANCFPGSGNGLTWDGALQVVNTLASGACGLSDGSAAGDWRLPNVKELQSLIDYGFVLPALSNAAGTGQWTEGDAFVNVQPLPSSSGYWSSTATAGSPDGAWVVYLTRGGVTIGFAKGNIERVWPVRGGD